MPSDGRWRIIILAGDVREVEQMEKINRLGTLFNGENGLVTNVTPRGCRLDSGESIWMILNWNGASGAGVDDTPLTEERSGIDTLSLHSVSSIRLWKGKNQYSRSLMTNDTDLCGWRELSEGSWSSLRGIRCSSPRWIDCDLSFWLAVGCVILVRPDQYISTVSSLDDHDRLRSFFDSVFIKRRWLIKPSSRFLLRIDEVIAWCLSARRWHDVCEDKVLYVQSFIGSCFVA